MEILLSLGLMCKHDNLSRVENLGSDRDKISQTEIIIVKLICNIILKKLL